MAVADDKGPMRGPRTTEEVVKSATAVAPEAQPGEGGQDRSAATPADGATKFIMTDQEAS